MRSRSTESAGRPGHQPVHRARTLIPHLEARVFEPRQRAPSGRGPQRPRSRRCREFSGCAAESRNRFRDPSACHSSRPMCEGATRSSVSRTRGARSSHASNCSNCVTSTGSGRVSPFSADSTRARSPGTQVSQPLHVRVESAAAVGTGAAGAAAARRRAAPPAVPAASTRSPTARRPRRRPSDPRAGWPPRRCTACPPCGSGQCRPRPSAARRRAAPSAGRR